ncbi:MAG: DUF2306 domain-containing protein [Pseudobdellovibrionaceae bacterium]
MKRSAANLNWLFWISGISFIYFTVEFFLSFNYFPDHLIRDYIFSVARRHYSVAIPGHLIQEKIFVNFHLLCGLLLVVLGLVQLNDRFRIRFRFWHRWLGVTYVALGFLAASMGLYLSQKALGGLITQVAFFIIAGLWYFTAYKAVSDVLNKNYPQHRRWMIRNYFLTLSTGFIRPFLFVVDLIIPGLRPETVFPIACWLSLILALLLSYWFLEKTQARSVFSAKTSR